MEGIIMDQEKAKQLISENIKNLPTLPDIVQKLITLIQDERTAASDLSKLISYDQAISLRLLKVANSAYYGFLKEVATIQHAIVILGLDEVKRLSLGIAMMNFMNGANDESSLKMEDFWKHSVGSSLVAQIISKKAGVESDVISTSSLLHDIGKVVLDNAFSKEYKLVMEKVKTESINTLEAEKEILGFGHTDVGLWLCSKWKLPPSLILPIAYHHQVEEADQDNILNVAIVHLADIVSHKAGIGNNGDSTIPPLSEVAKETLQINEEDMDSMVEDLLSEEEKVQAFISAIQ
jgi:putative nucleotidyltransferase with HDIG domain